jgi:hypothetical protein
MNKQTSRAELGCGLDVKPETALTKVNNRKKEMTIKPLHTALLAAALGLAVQAQAALYDFSFSGSGVSASGTLTTTGPLTLLTGQAVSGDGLYGYDITAMSGQVNGSPIVGIVPNPSFPSTVVDQNVYIDNALLVTPYGLDYNGLDFLVGSTYYNLSANNDPSGGGYSYWLLPYNGTGVGVGLTITAVPEPTTVVAGAGALGLVLLGMLRSKRSGVAKIGE